MHRAADLEIGDHLCRLFFGIAPAFRFQVSALCICCPADERLSAPRRLARDPAYLGGIIALGVWFGATSARPATTSSAAATSRGGASALSIVAAETSALTVIGVPAIAYGGNLMFIQMIIGYVIARVILAIVMVPHYLKGEIYSPYQLLEQHLGRARALGRRAFFLFLETLAAGVRVLCRLHSHPPDARRTVCSLGGLVDPILGAILLFVGLSLLYTYIGGMKAVIWTDAVQIRPLPRRRDFRAALHPHPDRRWLGAALAGRRRPASSPG
jgi:hypothetical protein